MPRKKKIAPFLPNPKGISIAGKFFQYPHIFQDSNHEPSLVGKQSNLRPTHFLISVLMRNEEAAWNFEQGIPDKKPLTEKQLIETILADFPHYRKLYDNSYPLALNRAKFNRGSLLSEFYPPVESFPYRSDGRAFNSRSSTCKVLSYEQKLERVAKHKIKDPRFIKELIIPKDETQKWKIKKGK